MSTPIYAKYPLREILGRMKAVDGKRYDTDLAASLGVSKAILGQWKDRETIPWDQLAQYAFAKGVSLDWLVLGRGPVRVADMAEKPSANTQGTREFLLTVTLTPVERIGP